MLLCILLPLLTEATTTVTLEIVTCSSQLGFDAGRVAEGYFRFHGTEGFTGWRKWDPIQQPGRAQQTADVDVGQMTDIVIGTATNATYNWCIETVLINGEALWNPNNVSTAVYLGLNCNGYENCNGAHVWMVPNTRNIESEICRSHSDCHNNQQNGEGYCDIFGNCYPEEWCCYYKDSFDGTCPNQASCDSGTHQCTQHSDCGNWDAESNRAESHFCTLYSYCEPVEWCCYYRNSINGPDECPTDCNPPEQHDVCREYSNARPCVPNFIFPYPLSLLECEDRCLQYEFCTGIQSHTHFGGWDECALILGDSCDLDEMRWFGGEYTLISRACFDPDLHDLVAENYTRHSGTNCVSQTSQSQWAFQELSQAVTTCNFLPDCQAVVDKGCDASTFYLCMTQDEITTSSTSCLYFKDALGRDPVISVEFDRRYEVRVHSCTGSADDAVLEMELIGHNGGMLLIPIRLTGNGGDDWTVGEFMGDIGPIDRIRLYPSTMERFCIDSLFVNGESWNSTFGTPELWLSSDCSAYQSQQCSELQYLENVYTIYTCLTVQSFEVDPGLVLKIVEDNGHVDAFVKVSAHSSDLHYFPIDTTRTRLLQTSMAVDEEFCFPGEITDIAFEVFAETLGSNGYEDMILGTGALEILRDLNGLENVVQGPRTVGLSSGHATPGTILINWKYTRDPSDEARESIVNHLHLAHCNGTQALQEFQCGRFVSEIGYNARACEIYRISPGAQCTLGDCDSPDFEGRDIICMESGVWHLEFTPTMAPTDGNAYIKFSTGQCEQVNVDTSCGDVSGLMELGFEPGFCGWPQICPQLSRAVHVSNDCGSYKTVVFPEQCDQCISGCTPSSYPVMINDTNSSETEYTWVFVLVVCVLVVCILVVFYMIWIQRRKKHAVRNLKTQERIRAFSKRHMSFEEPAYFDVPMSFPTLPANALAVNHYQSGDAVEICVDEEWKKSHVLIAEKMRVQVKIDGTENIHWVDVGSDKLREIPRQLSAPVVNTSIANAGAQTANTTPIYPELRKALNWKDNNVIRLQFESILVDQGVRLQDHEFQSIFSFLSNTNGMLSWKVFTSFLYAKPNQPYNPEEHPKLKSLRDQILYVINSKSEIIDMSDSLSRIQTPILPSTAEESSMSILLNVNMIETNTTINVVAKSGESVKTLIGRIREMTPIPELDYELSFEGKILDPSAPLSFYNITSNSKITARIIISENHVASSAI